jgi:tetratricopeptide (TPR) repeat protein
LGQYYYGLGHYDKAIKALKKALAIDPKISLPHLILGKIHLELGDKESAIQEYNVLEDMDKEDADQLYRMIAQR